MLYKENKFPRSEKFSIKISFFSKQNIPGYDTLSFMIVRNFSALNISMYTIWENFGEKNIGFATVVQVTVWNLLSKYHIQELGPVQNI